MSAGASPPQRIWKKGGNLANQIPTLKLAWQFMVDDSSLVRPFMEKHASQFCPDFDTFLRLVCTGEIYHDGDMIFVELPPA